MSNSRGAFCPIALNDKLYCWLMRSLSLNETTTTLSVNTRLHEWYGNNTRSQLELPGSPLHANQSPPPPRPHFHKPAPLCPLLIKHFWGFFCLYTEYINLCSFNFWNPPTYTPTHPHVTPLFGSPVRKSVRRSVRPRKKWC